MLHVHLALLDIIYSTFIYMLFCWGCNIIICSSGAFLSILAFAVADKLGNNETYITRVHDSCTTVQKVFKEMLSPDIGLLYMGRISNTTVIRNAINVIIVLRLHLHGLFGIPMKDFGLHTFQWLNGLLSSQSATTGGMLEQGRCLAAKCFQILLRFFLFCHLLMTTTDHME